MLGLKASAAAEVTAAGCLSYEGAFIDVRHAPVATKFRFAPKCRDVPILEVAVAA